MSEAFQHVNRRGHVYCLQSKAGDKGQVKYSFARNLTWTPVQQLPEGYEVREHPESGQVVIRRIKPSAIRPEEKSQLEKIIRDLTGELLFIVDVEERSLVVYVSDMDADVRIEMLRQILPMDIAAARRMKAGMIARAEYARMMRFTLTDAENRLFNMDRWCFKGSIDDWYFIKGNQPLEYLATKYIRHLGEESFFDLM